MKVQIWFRDGLNTYFSYSHGSTEEHFREERDNFDTINNISMQFKFPFHESKTRWKTHHFEVENEVMKVKIGFWDGFETSVLAVNAP